ncbi:TetR/AcrR family transcriptional regulator [Nocardioides ferulae]|uniref:TetR/AcrR family transcriptional regulator n=1 Tax=Nocardioides ferulae TaxID=2340821 RepID=UPI000EB33501|nr:TetR/AcrR family transcriptional regulator [Nocardioides ferulae]
MARPREHDRDALLDHALHLWVEQGTGGLTIRALSSRSGASTGALYHAFGSRDVILARVWAREAERFLAFQRRAVERALAEGSPRDAVVAAALAPADYVHHDEPAARLLLAVTPRDLAEGEVGPEDRERLRALRRALGALITELAERVWTATDPAAVALVRSCLVELPSALLLARDRVDDPVARHALEHAVRGVLAQPPPTSR